MGKLLIVIVLAVAAFYAHQQGLFKQLGNASLSEEDLLGAAKQGDINAMIRLGDAYDTGRFGEKDSGKALDWLKQAANRGSPEAAYLVGIVYSEGGSGVERDYVAAAAHFEQAARKGLGNAHYRLGTLYEKGRGVNRSYTRAYYSYQLSGRLGGPTDPESIARVGVLLNEKKRVQANGLVNADFVTFERLKDHNLSDNLKDIINSRETIKATGN